MLFSSYEFILCFVPVTLAGFYLLGRRSRDAALAWVIAASLFFYAWWRPVNVLLIAPSVLFNYFLAGLLLRWRETVPARATAVLLVGIAFNLCFLGYFKYLNFFRDTLNQALGTNMVLTTLILPLGISFITFQKIAFLIDVQAGRVKSFTLRDYTLFVLFFPQLIAGPIVHYREMMPQFQSASCRYDSENMAVGLTLFFFGLFKKLVLADAMAPLISPIYARAAAGEPVSLIFAWMAALGFVVQMYFDFSGYTDMALGLARFFGIKLPMNFNSPLKATSIIDYWQRWHITLTRFLTGYLYNPLALSLTRRRAAKGRSVLTPRKTTPGAFIALVAFPTLLTMLLSGFWHGAGFTFLVWGLLHGAYVTINHAWRSMRPSIWPDTARYVRFMTPVGFVLTFLAVAVSMVFFRAPSLASAFTLLKGMVGLHGVTLPNAVFERLGPLTPLAERLGVHGEIIGGNDFIMAAVRIAVLLFIAWVPPNTLQILARFDPALGFKPSPGDKSAKLGGVLSRALEWRPSPGWAVALSVVAALGILSLSEPSIFLYWKF